VSPVRLVIGAWYLEGWKMAAYQAVKSETQACPTCLGTGLDRRKATEAMGSQHPRDTTAKTVACGTCLGKGVVAR